MASLSWGLVGDFLLRLPLFFALAPTRLAVELAGVGKTGTEEAEEEADRLVMGPFVEASSGVDGCSLNNCC